MRRRLPYLVNLLCLDSGRWDVTLMVVPRMQFLAIELGRNRLKLNDWVHEAEEKTGSSRK